jgi:hypothetical protein
MHALCKDEICECTCHTHEKKEKFVPRITTRIINSNPTSKEDLASELKLSGFADRVKVRNAIVEST